MTTTIERTNNGVDISFPATPRWQIVSAYIVIAITSGIMVGAVMPRIQQGSDVTAILTILIAILLLFSSIPLIALAISVVHVRADSAGIEIVYELHGRRPVRVSRDELDDVTAMPPQSSSRQTNTRWTVAIVLKEGGAMKGSVIVVKTEAEADWIAGELRRVLFPDGHHGQTSSHRITPW